MDKITCLHIHDVMVNRELSQSWACTLDAGHKEDHSDGIHSWSTEVEWLTE